MQHEDSSTSEKIERLEWARELEQLERLKAKERQGTRTDNDNNIGQNFARSNDVVADQTGFGNKETYIQAKYIADNADPETIYEG